jgi:IS1 family transposase
MNQLNKEKTARVIACLCDGNSIRATARIADVSINTVVKILVKAGTACKEYHDEHIKNITAKRVQCDEAWSFVYAKEKNLPANMKGQDGVGSLWTWVGLDADSKLAISYFVGNRDAEAALAFMQDIEARLTSRVQLTTDGLRAYLEAVDEVFGSNIDFAQLVKMYGNAPEGEHRYSPAECTGAKKTAITGNPDEKHISTSYIERQNLTMRMSMRRFTRLTNAFSKKFENHKHAIALYFMHYNFVRIHKTTRVTPAMAVGVTNRLWEISDLVDLISK